MKYAQGHKYIGGVIFVLLLSFLCAGCNNRVNENCSDFYYKDPIVFRGFTAEELDTVLIKTYTKGGQLHRATYYLYGQPFEKSWDEYEMSLNDPIPAFCDLEIVINNIFTYKITEINVSNCEYRTMFGHTNDCCIKSFMLNGEATEISGNMTINKRRINHRD